MSIKGAGGTEGGVGQFLIGIAMMCGGFYMLFQSIIVTSDFGWRFGLYHVPLFGGFMLTTGMVLIPFIFGIGIIFFNSRNLIGWILSCGSLTAMVLGVISSVRINLRTMSAFELIVILVLSVGGLGLFLRSLKDLSRDSSQEK